MVLLQIVLHILMTELIGLALHQEIVIFLLVVILLLGMV